MKKTIPKKVKGKKENKKLWGGRFKASGTSAAESFNASISFDKRLYRHDIIGSIAQAKVLQRAGVLTAKEVTKIIKGLNSIQKEIETDKFCFRTVDEDIHMAIEKRLTEKIGALGGKLHTGRSRNDQVATDVRLYLKDEGALVSKAIKDLQSALISVAKKNMDAVMPGYTHLQRAQPILFSHHMMAYFEMLKRDAERLGEALKRVDVMPLGSGALAGSPYKLDRAYAAKLLKFSKVSANSLDAVSDRDFLIEFQSVASIIMVHISRLSEELILWSSSEFGFVEISDEFSTGSSIMPQKKNTDMAELAR
ncbi:MAG: argininosuccinate lyase, partial [Deltaproteobacteria bacterium]|nr:argininosuccinate lyase [Deltaproteobacteria bacterium]